MRGMGPGGTPGVIVVREAGRIAKGGPGQKGNGNSERKGHRVGGGNEARLVGDTEGRTEQETQKQYCRVTRGPGGRHRGQQGSWEY